LELDTDQEHIVHLLLGALPHAEAVRNGLMLVVHGQPGSGHDPLLQPAALQLLAVRATELVLQAIGEQVDPVARLSLERDLRKRP
jgi:hypothetical protein